MKSWGKIDKFYVIFSGVMILLSVLVIFTFKRIFSAIIIAYEIEPSQETEVKIDREKLDEAYNFVFNKLHAD